MPSSPVFPFDDPTLLFTNAGMNQFKDLFTGRGKVDYKRAVSSQKCIRAGGKHNDLDNVGFTNRHHTFFEMLGNFSFGDYFKEEAIVFAWEWLTVVLKLPKERLYATVYTDDDDAFELWGKIAPELKEGRILRFGKKDNYWSMGATGPCGPCSEIHFDRGEKFGTDANDVINGDTERFVEIWNLVFMQNDQQSDGKLLLLPKPSVDTGAGLERIAAIMQGVDSNFEIDIFKCVMGKIAELTGKKYKREHRSSFHVIADHIRALTFSIADGAGISNEGRGYVLRRILRRAARHARLLGAHEPFMYKLVPTLVAEMGGAYPELIEKQSHVQNVILAEEESFGRTLETGLNLFSKVAKKVMASGTTVVPGEDVFRLYDTYGFPYDLTELLAHEQGLTIDNDGFEKAMQAQQKRSRAGASFELAAISMTNILDSFQKEGIESVPETAFSRPELKISANIVKSAVSPFPDQVALVLERTPFYLEAGGQISDTGRIYNDAVEVNITGMSSHLGYTIHIGNAIRGSLLDIMPPVSVTAEVNAERRWDIMRNHTATHLLQAALRSVLGNHVKQSGSYVGPDNLRFDFSHHQPMTQKEISEVEEIANGQILKRIKIVSKEMSLEQAKKTGAMALFGEKYGDKVRVVSVRGDTEDKFFSIELCGGTHVNNTCEIGPFFITVETGVASGVRRIEAITGRVGTERMLENRQFKQETAQIVNRPESNALEGVRQLRDKLSELQKELKKARAAAVSGNQGLGRQISIGKVELHTHDFGETDSDSMSAWVDKQQSMAVPVVVVAVGVVGGKITVLIGASRSAVKEHGWHCGELAKEIMPQFGGRGGGKPSFAQGSVDAKTEASDLFRAVERSAKKRMGVAND